MIIENSNSALNRTYFQVVFLKLYYYNIFEIFQEFPNRQDCSSPSESASETATDTEVIINRPSQKPVVLQTPRRRSMFASTTVEVSEFESDNEDNYDRRSRRNSRRHSSRSDVKKKRHKILRQQTSDSNSENQSDNEDYNSSNYLHVPRDYKNGRRRKNSERRRLINIDNKGRRGEPSKTDRCNLTNSSNIITLNVEDQNERYRKSSYESVQSNTNDVPVFFCSIDSLSEDQNSKSTSSSQIHRQDAICFSSSSSIISDNVTSSRRRHSASPSPTRERRYNTKTRERSRASSADFLESPSNLTGSNNCLQVSTTENNSRRCSDESVRSKRSNQSDASQYYRGM